MKLTVNQSDLKLALNRIGPALKSRSTLPCMSCVKLEAVEGLSLTATNLDLRITEKIEANISQEGAVLVSARTLSGMVSELQGGEVALNLKGSTLLIEAGSARLSLPTVDLKEFPATQDIEGLRIEIPQGTLRRALRCAIVAASTDYTRMVLNSVSFLAKSEHLEVTATDGKRIHHIKLGIPDCSNGCECVMPTAMAIALISLLTDCDRAASVTVSSSAIRAKFDKSDIWSLQIAERYPHWRQCLPRGGERATVLRDELQRAISLARSAINPKDAPHILLDFSKNRLEISGKSESSAVSSIAIKYDAEPVSVMLNCDYALDVARTATGDELTIEIVDDLTPVVFRSGEFMALVMVMRK